MDINNRPGAGDDNTTSLDRFLRCAKQGLLKHAVPQHHGGYGDSFADLIIAHEKLGKESQDCGLMLSLNAHLWGAVFPILIYGDDEQRLYYLEKLLNGRLVGGHAITETQAGSDLNGLTMSAEKRESAYILNGHKRFITNTPIADLLVVYARLNDKLTAFIIHSDDVGANFLDTPQVSGCRNATMGDVVLENCVIPTNRLLGKIGAGNMLIQQALELERGFIFAGILGVMDWQLQTTIQHSRERRVNGVHLGKHQAISHKIADMKLRLDSVRLWVNECARLKDEGKRITLASAQTKLYAAEAFLQSSLDAVQIFGSQGLIEGNSMTKLVDDALASRLFSGSSEIQKNIIAALLGTGDGYR